MSCQHHHDVLYPWTSLQEEPKSIPRFCTNPRSFPSSLSTPVPCCQKRGWCAVADCGTHWWADWWSRQLSPHPGSRVLCNWSTARSDQQSDQTRLSTDQIAICTLQVNPMQSHTGPSSSFQVKINEQSPYQRSKSNWQSNALHIVVHSHVKRTTAYKFDLQSSYSLQNIWMWDWHWCWDSRPTTHHEKCFTMVDGTFILREDSSFGSM